MTRPAGRRVRRRDDALATVNKAVAACSEAKAKDIAVLDMRDLVALTDYFVVASGRSDRQVQGIANRVLDALSEAGTGPVSVEGLDQGQWVLIDGGSVIVHLFYEPTRAHYDIEGLWSAAKRLVVSGDGGHTKVLSAAA